MTIAELFVKLGLKGADETKKGLVEVRKTLGNISTASLEAKAAILAALYALQKLSSGSAATGTSLNNFATLTGLNVKELQKWQWAMEQTGGTADDFQSSLESLQDNMTKMVKFGQGAPMGFGDFQRSVKLDRSKLTDTFYVMQKLQEYSKIRSPNVARQLMESFGLSKGTISALMQGAFNEKNFKSAPVYSEKQVKNLHSINVEWSNLYRKLEMITGKLNSKYGLQLIKDISAISVQLGHLVENLVLFAGKAHLFEGISFVFRGWILLFQQLNQLIDEADQKLNPDKKKSEYQKTKEQANPFDISIMGSMADMINFITMGKYKDQIHENLLKVDPTYKARYMEEKGLSSLPPPVTNNINITNNGVHDKNLSDKVTESLNKTLNSIKATSPTNAGGQ